VATGTGSRVNYEMWKFKMCWDSLSFKLLAGFLQFL